ncbi:hypothetical protein GCM10010983_51720 [Caulobacter rhizosphaerae]|nr:hypothetical protein GCM10010983_51720 [Caulobacter rhizosphaerae]
MRVPTRRNRNIGTAKQGHGVDNRLVIPWPTSEERVWYAMLGPHQRIRVPIAGYEMLFVVEENHGGCVHACSVADIARVLENLPRTDWEDLAAIVLRQPTRKARLLSPVWGRFAYSADLGLRRRSSFCTGPMVFIEAVDPTRPIEWSGALGPDGQAELARLAEDGHEVEQAGSRWIVSPSLEAVRATQLYRTLPHEIGHHVDWLEKVARAPADSPDDWDARAAAFFARPREEREAFAHRYADAANERLRRFGLVPFAPLA